MLVGLALPGAEALMDPFTQWIQTNAPVVLGVLTASSVAVKFIVNLFRHFVPTAQGNVVQSVTFGIAEIVVWAESAAAGAFAAGVSWKPVVAVLIGGGLVGAGAIGVHEALQDRNVPPTAPEKPNV